jgi:hypothetical protein
MFTVALHARGRLNRQAQPAHDSLSTQRAGHSNAAACHMRSSQLFIVYAFSHPRLRPLHSRPLARARSLYHALHPHPRALLLLWVHSGLERRRAPATTRSTSQRPLNHREAPHSGRLDAPVRISGGPQTRIAAEDPATSAQRGKTEHLLYSSAGRPPAWCTQLRERGYSCVVVCVCVCVCVCVGGGGSACLVWAAPPGRWEKAPPRTR